jgi:hypothetical protein
MDRYHPSPGADHAISIGPGLVNLQKAMEHGHRNSGFTIFIENGDFA